MLQITFLAQTTHRHRPGVFRPIIPSYYAAETYTTKRSTSNYGSTIESDSIYINPGTLTTKKSQKDEFMMWFTQTKPKKTKYDFRKYIVTQIHNILKVRGKVFCLAS